MASVNAGDSDSDCAGQMGQIDLESQISVQETIPPSHSISINEEDESDGSDAKMFAQGNVLCSADTCFLDLGKVQKLTVDGKIKEAIEEFRQEMSKEMQQLEDRVSAGNKKLKLITQERDDLEERLEKENKEKTKNAEWVRQLMEDKSKLEDTISSLQHELRTFKAQIEIAMNQNRSLEAQINELQQKSEEKKQDNGADKDLITALCTAISSVVMHHSSGQQPEHYEMMMALQLQKAKQEFKNGSENYKNLGNGGNDSTRH